MKKKVKTNVVPLIHSTVTNEALKTTAEYMEEAVKRIDRQFGDGYAIKHPSLIGSFMQTVAAAEASYHAAGMAEDLNYIGTALDHLTEALEKK